MNNKSLLTDFISENPHWVAFFFEQLIRNSKSSSELLADTISRSKPSGSLYVYAEAVTTHSRYMWSKEVKHTELIHLYLAGPMTGTLEPRRETILSASGNAHYHERSPRYNCTSWLNLESLSRSERAVNRRSELFLEAREFKTIQSPATTRKENYNVDKAITSRTWLIHAGNQQKHF